MTVDLRLAIPAGIAWIAVWILLGIPAALPLAVVVCWAMAAASTVVAVLARRWGKSARTRRRGIVGAGSRRWAAFAVVIATAAAMVLSSAAVRDQQRHPDWMTAAASSGRFVVATATTTETLHAGQDRFDATLESVTIGGRTTAVEVPVTVFGSAQSSPAQSPAAQSATVVGLGSTITLSGTLADTDPGESSAYLFFSSSSAATSVVSEPPWFLDWANALRAGFQDAAAALPGDGAGLLPGLAIGDTSAVSAELNSAMKTSSLRRTIYLYGHPYGHSDLYTSEQRQDRA